MKDKTLGRKITDTIRWVLTGIAPGSLQHDDLVKLLDKPNPIIFEIGCNDGTDTIEMLRRFPLAQIYCFEPDPRAIKRFKEKLGDNLNKIKLIEMAISDKNGSIEFHQSDGNLGDLEEGWDASGSIRAPKNHLKLHPKVKFDQVIQVQTRTLDDICENLGISNIDFVWLDVQGAEGDVFRGARHMLKHIKYIYTEYSNAELYEGQLSLQGLKRLLSDFKVTRRYPADVLFEHHKVSKE